MDAKALLARMAAQREAWCDLAAAGERYAGLRVQYRRPPEVELPRLRAGVLIEHVVDYACGWEGFTEATLLGAAVGASDPVPFDREVWAAWVRDHVDVVSLVAKAMSETVSAYLVQREATAKNSPPSST